MPKRTEFVGFNENLPEEQERSLAAWQHPGDAMDSAEQAPTLGLLLELSAGMTRVFGFIAAGKSVKAMGARSWVVLYVMRPDLVAGESLRSYSARMGVSDGYVKKLVAQFRAEFPGIELLHSPNKSSKRGAAHPR